MEIIDLQIKDVKLIRPKTFGDDRGYFSETFKLSSYEDLVNGRKFVQDNQSLSKDKYVLRGLTCTLAPICAAVGPFLSVSLRGHDCLTNMKSI